LIKETTIASWLEVLGLLNNVPAPKDNAEVKNFPILVDEWPATAWQPKNCVREEEDPHEGRPEEEDGQRTAIVDNFFCPFAHARVFLSIETMDKNVDS